MNRTKEVSELKKLAYPALQHVELVSLAKEHSPNKAQELAGGRWPRRQARACRFLAILRRDFPKAFEVFINPPPSEHVRAEKSALSTLEEEENGAPGKFKSR